MLTKIILLILIIDIFCVDFYEDIENFISEANMTDLVEVDKKIREYERNYKSIYIKTARNKAILCVDLDNSIKSLLDIKYNYTQTLQVIDSGKINNTDIRKFFDIRGDIEFGKRNIEIIVDRLNKTRSSCFNSSSNLEDYLDKEREKNKKSKAELIHAFNQIVNLENAENDL